MRQKILLSSLLCLAASLPSTQAEPTVHFSGRVDALDTTLSDQLDLLIEHERTGLLIAAHPAPQQASHQAPRQAPQQASHEAPRQAPQQASHQAPRQVPQQASHQAPRQAPQQASHQAPHMAAQPVRTAPRQERMVPRVAPPERTASAPKEMQRSPRQGSSANHEVATGRSPEESHAMPATESRHSQPPSAQMTHGIRTGSSFPPQGAQRLDEHASSHQPYQTNSRAEITGMHPNSPPHVSPITKASPPRLQSEHELAMLHLQQGHTPQLPAARNGWATPGRVAAGVVGGAALTGLASHQMAAPQMHGQPDEQRNRSSEPPKPGEQGAKRKHAIAAGERGSTGTTGIRNVPPPPRYANPRRLSQQRSSEMPYSKKPAGPLAYRSGVSLFPHSGDRHKGVPGIYDPGGYIRTPQRAGTRINRDYAHQQLAMMPNYQRDMSSNGRNMVSDRGAWPWRIPQQSTSWNPFGGGQGPNYGQGNGPYGGNPNGYDNQSNNPYGYGNQYNSDPYDGLNPYAGYPYGIYGNNAYWNDWDNYDSWDNWNNDYANAQPFYGNGIDFGVLNFLGSMFRGRDVGVVPGGEANDWLSNLLYFTGYSISGNNYPVNYFAMNGYAPTPYLFSVASGQFWQPGVGYTDYLPDNYQAPISVSVQEVVPSFDDRRKIVGYQPQTFYYNAYWDADARSFGYYDYRNKFHWLTFPGLSSYANG